MVFNIFQDYQVKINEKMKVIVLFLISLFIITCLFSINTAHSVELVSGSGDNSTIKLNQKPSGSSHNYTTNDYSNSLPDLFDKVEKSVVQITEPGSTQTTEPNPSRLGSGFVYDKLGHIVTNFHVVDGSKDNQVYVTFLDGVSYEGDIVGTDPYSDLAVIKLSDVDKNVSSKLVPLELGNSSIIRIGQKVVAVGNPFGLSGSLSEGIISGLGRLMPAGDNGDSPQNPFDKTQIMKPVPSFSIPDIIQTDAAINPGNSGGPLIDMNANVIGINTAIFSNTGVYSGIGFAIPSNFLTKIVPLLIKNGEYDHPYIGINGFDITPEIAKLLNLPEAVGFLVINVTEDSPAKLAGVQGGNKSMRINGLPIELGGDVVTEIDNKPVRKVDDILSYLENYKRIGDSVTLTVLRGPDLAKEVVTIQLTARPSLETNLSNPSLGVIGLDVTPEIAKLMNISRDNGFLITSIIGNSSASKANLRGGYLVTEVNGAVIELGGDIIVKMDNLGIKNQLDIKNYLKTKNIGDSIIITVLRDDNYLTKSLSLEPFSENQRILQDSTIAENNSAPLLSQDDFKQFLESCAKVLPREACESMIIIK
ncbi:trypsin-like peptidase domain-containing protein [Candidatus Nitrosocosmicus arcticus]|uniref:Putative 2-alkenal reductase (Modular protein) n=1 Tax=Candidatus Nitrosocosmicus arcticus TaxID=2035267 RepID=A0A557STJ9_9ARCH|nr:trypsin-like peptidase domain-containing protein [Candidatus Nitrosocosmicus arcticus]TVP39936.1 putative 2-alkenal reductase (modular protein) [Candidatus Nitrosocosmicus arcticus]